MTGNELKKILKNKFNVNELVEISRYSIDDCSMLVNPEKISDKLLLVQQCADFSVDGYKILRNEDISEVVMCDKNPGLKFTNMIFVKEKLFADKVSVNLDSWQTVMSEFAKNGKAVMIECAYDDAVDYYFCKVLSVNGKIAELKCFDGAGEVFADIIKINLDFVSSVTFSDKYTTYMSKYVKW